MRRALMMMLVMAFIIVIAGVSQAVTVADISGNLPDQAALKNLNQPGNTREPSWEFLRRMTNTEKTNATIQIELGQDVAAAAKSAATQVENLWNSGQFENALNGFGQLSQINGVGPIAIGVCWRNPIPTDNVSLWGTDVRIGNRDSIYINCLDIHRASGHLFAILAYTEGGGGYWSVNLSDNGGVSWNETYVWYAGSGEQAVSMSASVLGNYCYVAYRPSDFPYEARLRRFYASNGLAYPAYTIVYSTVAPDTIREVVITSNQDYFDNRIYYLGLAKNGDLRLFWDDTTATSWLEISTDVTDAERGLDATCNEGYDTRFLWVSYIDINDTLNIDYLATGNIYGSAKNIYVANVPASVSIAAYNDTLICFYGVFGSIYHCKYHISYTGGSTWVYGAVDDTLTYMSYYADATARNGGGFGVVYRYYTPTRALRYVWRNYPMNPSWSSPVSIADFEPDPVKPSIEYIGGGVYGTVYTSWTSPIQAAYFDRSSPACEYFPGDINGDGVRIGGDVTYGVRYFKGVGAPPPDSCYMDSISDYLYVAGDVNGNCEFRGSDITRLVSFFKGTSVLSTCHFFPGPPLRDVNRHEMPEEVLNR